MQSDNQPISAIPTNIITGFLGVGKTSAIKHLLAQKPEDERWAILVNEFGEIGIDGNLLSGKKDEQVYIREVPGGCMCCASGLPMQIALNQLLSEAKPHRLLIEPTGLGHPLEVLQLLSNQYYQQLLSLEKVITLVDARNLTDTRYTEHATFNQQIAIADVVVGNKLDLYQGTQKTQLELFLAEKGFDSKQLEFCSHGQLSPQWLSGKTINNAKPPCHHHHHHDADPARDINAEPFPEDGFLKAQNEGEGFVSVGWRFAPEQVFDRDKLRVFVTSVDAERLKAVFITMDGIFGYNKTVDGTTEIELDECIESRIEIIGENLSPDLEATLLTCLVAHQ
ncbi:GTP-binding protein [Pseudoalteromonas luteoviolacea]|uniref:CobW family GTP-binding protein n=1 Tax=Pseudoalteromonas luteoviolacea TaxID=43657 RepID=UPI001B3A6819|nr:GTP-binding protein [Pseudoalteromonas luteoviolacea]MBQ4877805.1 GTP-binding protein [Pseudoalteromonas luteoviolacea]MBQ4906749.1 GTP-binding protein [Pseudoalteromonas luteoviolacea]